VCLTLGYHEAMTSPLRVVVTGASGFLGRLLVQLLRRRHVVLAIDRRTLAEAELAGHPNVQWYPVDLCDADAVAGTMACIAAGGGAQVVIHLAAYYDFTGEEHPEYRRTNVDAMRILLDSCRGLGVGHFVFASSVAACRFSSPGAPITEATPADGTHIYARTKRAGERMLAEYRDSFTPLIVRFAAMFSDWCEYPPLQVLLDTWFGGGWNARILAGRGESAIPYLHVRDGGFFMMRLLERRHELEPMEVLLAGEDGAVSHLDLYRAATGHVDGRPRRAIHLPRPLCRPGVWLRDVVGRALGSRPFERPWMADYIDRRMEIDAGRTRQRLGWSPTPRLSLLDRLPFLIEHRRDNPLEWYRRNREALEHLQLTPNVRIYRLIKRYEPRIEQELGEALLGRESRAGVTTEQRLWDHRQTLRNLLVSVQTGENEPFLGWCRDLAERRVTKGFDMNEVVQALRIVDRVVVETLRGDPEAADLDRALRDHVSTRVEFGIDRVIEVYEDAASFGVDVSR
jgi:nucleoside-diphosphate-sugar epimerase